MPSDNPPTRPLRDTETPTAWDGCSCYAWQANFEKVNAPFMLAAARNPSQRGYDGEPFGYCPWCGTGLTGASRASAAFDRSRSYPDGAAALTPPAAPVVGETPTLLCRALIPFVTMDKAINPPLPGTLRCGHPMPCPRHPAPLDGERATPDACEACAGGGCVECGGTGRWYRRTSRRRAAHERTPDPAPLNEGRKLETFYGEPAARLIRSLSASLTAEREARQTMWEEREGWKRTASERGFAVIALGQALTKYGAHLSGCYSKGGGDYCTCGLTDLRATTKRPEVDAVDPVSEANGFVVHPSVSSDTATASIAALRPDGGGTT